MPNRHRPVAWKMCRWCGRRVRDGERWCKGTDADGYECSVDLTDTDNLITEYV